MSASRERWVVAGAGYLLFVLAYGLLGHCPLREPTVLLPGGIDRAIGVHPAMVWIYLSQFALLVVAIGGCQERTRLIRAGRAALIACVISFIIFLIWPTTVPRPALTVSEPTRTAYRLLYGVDPATNCVPSLHTALASIAGYALATRTWRSVVLLWCLLIIASTIMTGQHHLVDVVAGVGVAVVSLGAACRWTRLRTQPVSRPGSVPGQEPLRPADPKASRHLSHQA